MAPVSPNPNPNPNLFIVTGTTKGLGQSLVEVLSADPANVVIAFSRFAAPADSDQNGSASSEKVDNTCAVLGENGRNANIYADLSDSASTVNACGVAARHLASLALNNFDRAVLINNAGVLHPAGQFEQLTHDALTANFAVNVAAPMALTAWFTQQTRGRAASRMVVNISSGAAKRSIAGWSAYCAAKAALEMATRVAAEEAKSSDGDLIICSLAPGVVDTPMQSSVRSLSSSQFPDVERFRSMKADGILRPPLAVAQEIVALLPNAHFLQEARQHINLDIRTLNAN